MANEPDYGIDAPHVVLNLFAAGIACGFLALLFPRFTFRQVTVTLYPGFLYSAALFLLPVILMLVYSRAGKFRHRDRMLAKVSWAGTEMVLDVGTGRGLLLIGAAKRLTIGYATGIDIWNAEDLSGNSPHALLENIVLESVGGKADVKNEDARKMSFPDRTFDVVLSNLCLHNIYQQEGRDQACREIARVLKLGGIAVISDFKHMQEYATAFAASGLTVEIDPPDWTGTFPPLRILVARKPA
jgi:SAM-dependent methyltransferase